MKRSLLTILLVACLIGCGFILRQTTLAQEYAAENLTGYADIVAGHLGLAMVGSFYTGIGMVVTCILGMLLLWRRWTGLNRGMWVAVLIACLLGGLLASDATEMIRVFKEIGREAMANAKLLPVRTGNWFWFERENLAGGVSAVPFYVTFLLGQKALAGAITVGVLLLGNLALGRKQSGAVDQEGL